MPLSLLFANVPLPALPLDAMLVLTLAAAVSLMAGHDAAEPPPSEDVTSAAIFALHGHV